MCTWLKHNLNYISSNLAQKCFVLSQKSVKFEHQEICEPHPHPHHVVAYTCIKFQALNILISLQLNAQYVVSAAYLVSHLKQIKETCSVGLWEFHVDHGVFIVKQPPSILFDVQLNIRLHVTVGLLVSWSTWCKKCITHITARRAVWKSKTVKKAF